MFKTISAAVLAVSVLAAPAMAGTTVIKTHKAPVARHVTLKRSIANANAKMVVVERHHHHHHHHHYR